MEVTGKVTLLTPSVSGVSKAGTNYTTATLVVETQEQYPRTMAFDLYVGEKSRNDVIKDAQQFPEGSVVTVLFDIDSREGSNGRWWTSLKAWRVSAPQASEPTLPTPQPQPLPKAPTLPSVNANDELPF